MQPRVGLVRRRRAWRPTTVAAHVVVMMVVCSALDRIRPPKMEEPQ